MIKQGNAKINLYIFNVTRYPVLFIVHKTPLSDTFYIECFVFLNMVDVIDFNERLANHVSC